MSSVPMQQRNRPMPKVTFVYANGRRLDAQAHEGESILALAWRLDAGIEGDCEGAMACSTCHVILEEKAFDALPSPSEEEDSILDLAPGASKTSRLGCQIIITTKMDGLIIHMPATAPSLL
jgi:ferredoxin, 2Fe-2S